MTDIEIGAPGTRKRRATPVVVRSKAGRPKEKLVHTDDDLPDLNVFAMSEVRQALIRAARTFIQTFLSALGVAGVGEAAGPGQISAADFGSQAGTAALVALVAAVIAFLWNIGELLARLDNPKYRA